MMNKNKGITLIALVITIIVLLILAGVSIAMLTGESGVITQAQKAKISTELSGYKEELELYKISKLTENQEFLDGSLTAGKTNLSYNTQKAGETGNIKTVITSISDEYMEKLEIIKGELLINTKSKDEIKIAQSLGIEVNPYDITEEGELLSSNGNLLLMDENGTLTIPDSVTKIGEGAFANLNGLKTIIIPGSVKVIGTDAFSYNTTLETVIMQEGVEKIYNWAFAGCSNLKNVTMPNSLNFIGDMAFYYCVNLEEIVIPNKIKEIPGNCFAGDVKLKHVVLPNQLLNIKGSAFSMTGISQIDIPNTVNMIEKGAFESCNNLNNIELNNSQYYVYENGFLMPKDKTSIMFISPNYLKSVDTLKIPEGVQDFSNNIINFNNIKKLEIPSSLINVSLRIFPSSISQVIIDTNNPKYISENNLWYTKDTKRLVMCYSKEQDVRIQEGILVAEDGAFGAAVNATSITLPDSLTHISGQAFNACRNLKTIKIGRNVQEISPIMMLFECKAEVIIDEANPYYMVENGVLYSKDKKVLKACLKTFTGEFVVDSQVEKIAPNAFNNQKITKVTIPENVKEIERVAFTQCKELQSAEIANGVTTIGESAFERCQNLNIINIDKKANSIAGAPWGAPKGMKVVNWRG